VITFPAETVPDGSVALSHHYTWALLLALVPILMVWDRYPTRDPWMMLTALLAGLIGFVLVWPTHHVLGAVLALGANLTVLALAGYHVVQDGVLGRGRWRVLPLVAIVVLALLALDDVLQHALGWPTPLDFLWNEYLRPALPSH